MAGEIKLKIDPQALRQARMVNPNESRQAVTEEDINGCTLALKKERDPEILPVPVAEPPVKTVEVSQSKRSIKKRLKEVDIQNQQRKHPKRVATGAEKEYYRTLLISIFVLIGGVGVALAIAIGIISFYLVTRIIDDPAHGVTIHTAAQDVKSAKGISEKYAIVMKAYESIRNPYIAPYMEEDEAQPSGAKKVVKGVTGYMRSIKSARDVSNRAANASGHDEE